MTHYANDGLPAPGVAALMACLLLSFVAPAGAQSADQAPPVQPSGTKPPATPTPAEPATPPPTTSAMSPEQTAAAVRQRMRRCQLHPGTCVQKESQPDTSSNPRD